MLHYSKPCWKGRTTNPRVRTSDSKSLLPPLLKWYCYFILFFCFNYMHIKCVCVQLQKSEMLVTTLMGKQTYKNTKLILKKIVYPSNVKVKWLKEIKVSGWRGDGWGWDSRGCVEDFSVIYVDNYHPIYLWRTKQDFTSKY